MLPYKEELIEKKIRYKTNPTAWYSLHRSREISLFEQEKIITPEISFGTNMTLDSGQHFHNTKCYSLVKDPQSPFHYKYLIAVLNSSVMWYYLKSTGYVLRGGFFTFKTKFLEPFPIPSASKEQEAPLVELVDTMLERNAALYDAHSSFTQLIRSKYSLQSLSRNLENWPSLDFKAFLKELKKLKISLTLGEEAEWMSYFNEQKAKAQALQAQIDRTDKEIDRMVYALYGLSEEEVAVVEGREVEPASL
jgi:hypothetical protein